MAEVLDTLLADLERRGLTAALARGGRGLEKESLRFTPEGDLAQTPHPEALGSALTHPRITTDFSEAQLELITGVHPDAERALTELDEVQRFVYARLGDESLWNSSMPCILQQGDEIPLAQFGRANVGRAKNVYRRGLGWRYGRPMQTISGIHYNYSFASELWTWFRDQRSPGMSEQTARSIGYFALIRNFRRCAWLPIYLFGASPALCHTFLGDQPHDLDRIGTGTLYRPHATSLRMGDLGYQSSAQAALHVSYNSLDAYAETLFGALTTPHPDYERIGVKVDGEYRQLSTSLLQIENEFYGTIRPKRAINSGERPLHALDERGVEYVEVRCMDVNPYLPLGIDAQTLRFLDVFLTWCLLMPSPPDSPAESRELADNQRAVVEEGRRPDLTLRHDGGRRSLVDWADEILSGCERVARAMDLGIDGQPAERHAQAVAEARARVMDSSRTPSARLLADLSDHDDSYYRLARTLCSAHRDDALARPLEPQRLRVLERMSTESLAEQARIEAADTMDFETYLQAYLDPHGLRVRERASVSA